MNPRRHFFLISFLTVSVSLTAQKTLTVQNAVENQWRSFYPEQLNNPQWIPGTTTLTYHDQNWRGIMAKESGKKEEAIVGFGDIADATGAKIGYMPTVQWIDKESFYFQTGSVIYSYNYKDQEGEKHATLPGDAENIELHVGSGHTAYTVGNNVYVNTGGTEAVEGTNESNTNIVSGQAIARSEFGIRKGTFWSPDGNYLAFYQKDESNVTDYPLLNVNETPAQTKNIKYPMAGQGNEKAKLGVIDVKKGKTSYLNIDNSNDQFITNVSWSPDEQYVYAVIVNRAQNHIWVNRYDRKSGDLDKTLFEEEHDKYVEPEHAVWFESEKAKEFIWWSERNGYTHLYRYDLEGNLIGQVTKGKWVVTEILGTTKKGDLIVMGTDETGLNMYAYQVPKEGGDAVRLTKDDGVHSCQLSDDGRYLSDVYSNIKTPAVSQIIDIKKDKTERLIMAKNPLKDYAISEPELIQLKADDGTPLHARMIKPSNFDPKKKYPVLVYVYGGPHAQMINNSWLASAQLWMYAFAEKGYIVFTLDNRGSANRGFEFENVIHRQLGTTEMKDQLVGVEYLKKQPYIDSERMGIHGWSFGGFMTCTMMTRAAGTFKVGVAGGAVTDWSYYEIMYGERYMDTPEENPDGYRESRIGNHIDKLEGDLMLIHGWMDDVVVPQHALSLVQEGLSQGKVLDFFPYPNQKHGVGGPERTLLMQQILGYIEEKLNQ